MKFKYREISEERCREIDSWKICDPYGYGNKLSTHGNYWVSDEDESILFCHAFMPRHDDRENKYEVFLFIDNSKYYFITYGYEAVIDEKMGETRIRNENIMITEEKFINESMNKKELLELLKILISKYEENKCDLKIARETEYRFKFTYNGEEI